MSFTFKGMLSSLSRSDFSKSTETIGADKQTKDDNYVAKNDENTICPNGDSHRSPASEAIGLAGLKRVPPTKRSLSRRGKKKLSAMMSKINSSINAGVKAKSVSIMEQNNNIISAKVNGCDESDDDEEFCEPLCQDELDELELEQKQQMTVKSSRSSSFVDKSSPKNKPSEDHEDEDDNKAGLMPEEECDIPTFLHTKDCDKQLIETTRVLLKERFAKNPDNFYQDDYQRMLEDDWTVSRFLLRRRLDPKRTAKLMEECGRFRRQYKMSEVKLWEFPIEFHKAGGLFKYAPDRVGNLTVYMRVKMYRRVPEISDVFKAFILCVLEMADVENKGRGVAVVFDLSGCGLQNVDLGFLSWLLSSFRNYCPKGVSYILVYNLPWILSTTCRMAMTWMSVTNRRALRFVNGDEIENFIAKENLPDYLGGTCRVNYRAIPEGSKKATEVCEQLDITREQALKIKELFKEYLSDDDDEIEEYSKSGKKAKKSNKTSSKRSDGKTDASSKDTKSTIDCDTPTTKQPQELVTANGRMDLENHLAPSADFVSQASKFIA